MIDVVWNDDDDNDEEDNHDRDHNEDNVDFFTCSADLPSSA